MRYAQSTWAIWSTLCPEVTTPRLIVSPVALPSRSRNGCATATSEDPPPSRQAKLTNISPGRNRPWSSRRTRWLRSSASSSRDVVDLASPVRTVSSVNVTGSDACTTSDSSVAARSTACVPLGLLIPRLAYRAKPRYGTKFYDMALGVNRDDHLRSAREHVGRKSCGKHQRRMRVD